MSGLSRTDRRAFKARRRGEPIAAFAALILMWIGVRMWMLAGSVVAPAEGLLVAAEVQAEVASLVMPDQNVHNDAESTLNRTKRVIERPNEPFARVIAPVPQMTEVAPKTSPKFAVPILSSLALQTASPTPVPRLDAAPLPVMPARQDRPRTKRWSADGWILMREGPATTDGGIAPATLGGSQVGAVLRYHPGIGRANRSAIYARASSSLGDDTAQEAALGISIRPIRTIPIQAHVEARILESGGDAEVRPAAFLAGGFDRAPLPLGLEARGYGQAGYVGGDYETAFADGQIVADREVVSVDAGGSAVALRIGAGAWGGAQEGASRADIGPSASVTVSRGQLSARLSAEYRFKVAGDAEPSSGPALTITAGF
ncbi:hypothetical protein [Qipengyuania atrilutea]|uniref:Uncharacterized protein n=1 Tax=Qipengyuania atrilutea TaxID=2744473 RepID=A0A850H0K3_9SPHN|nr:hypothetical protein [Actirhodobacter atriluteus]NVD45421.1 hypothetical protein [Actirhodobacter atriluteus]